jgi:hypothetical protein
MSEPVGPQYGIEPIRTTTAIRTPMVITSRVIADGPVVKTQASRDQSDAGV